MHRCTYTYIVCVCIYSHIHIYIYMHILYCLLGIYTQCYTPTYCCFSLAICSPCFSSCSIIASPSCAFLQVLKKPASPMLYTNANVQSPLGECQCPITTRIVTLILRC